MKSFGSFTELDVWKKSRVWRISMFKTTKSFPKEEKYRLTDQLIRSSRSVTANIAEGHGRFHYQENMQYCRIARGSLSESLEHLICAYDCKYIELQSLQEFKKEIDEIQKLLNGYIRFLKKQKYTK